MGFTTKDEDFPGYVRLLEVPFSQGFENQGSETCSQQMVACCGLFSARLRHTLLISKYSLKYLLKNMFEKNAHIFPNHQPPGFAIIT